MNGNATSINKDVTVSGNDIYMPALAGAGGIVIANFNQIPWIGWGLFGWQ